MTLKNLFRALSITYFAIYLGGCVTTNHFVPNVVSINSAISDYESAASKINLGDSKNRVLSILEPTQKLLTNAQKKQSESYVEDGRSIYIYFARSGWQSDGLTTDDEFTPYVFIDNKLSGIGWSQLGGAKSTGQSSGDSETARQLRIMNLRSISPYYNW